MNKRRYLQLLIIMVQVGLDYGVRDVGTLTQRFMRIERFIPFWAEELSSFTTPFEAGNAYTVRLDKVIMECLLHLFRIKLHTIKYMQ